MNRQLFRASVLVAVLASAAVTTKNNNVVEGHYRHELVLIHLLSFSAWFGCSVWVSFVAGLVMFKNLPRHVFGRLQAKLFPAYFWFSALTMAVAMLSSHALGWKMEALGLIFGSILLNLVYLEPKTTNVMFLRHKVERRLGTGNEVGIIKPKDPVKANDPELKKLSKQFGMLHGISTLLNLIALAIGCYWLNFCTLQVVTGN